MEDRLYKFACIVELGSFTKAANRLHVSQPALTAAVQKLERDLKAELLIRRNRTLILTTAGKSAYQTAKNLQTETHNLKQAILQQQNEPQPFHIGIIDSIAELLFVQNDYLSLLDQQANVALTVNNSSELLRLLSHDQLDVSIVVEPTVIPRSLQTNLLGKEPLVLVCSPDFAAKHNTTLSKGRIPNFLAYNQNSQTYALIERQLTDHYIERDIIFYSTSPGIILETVLLNRGAAVLPYLLVKNYLKKGVLITPPLTIGIFARHIIAAKANGRYQTTAAKELITHTKFQLEALYKEATTSLIG